MYSEKAKTEQLIHISKQNGVHYDVVVSEAQLAAFQDLAAAASNGGRAITFDDVVLHEIEKVVDGMSHKIDEMLRDVQEGIQK